MKHALLALLAAVSLTACNNGYQELEFAVLPDDLKDCKFYSVRNKDMVRMQVVRCPGSSTTATYKSGKSTYSTATVEE